MSALLPPLPPLFPPLPTPTIFVYFQRGMLILKSWFVMEKRVEVSVGEEGVALVGWLLTQYAPEICIYVWRERKRERERERESVCVCT